MTSFSSFPWVYVLNPAFLYSSFYSQERGWGHEVVTHTSSPAFVSYWSRAPRSGRLQQLSVHRCHHIYISLYMQMFLGRKSLTSLLIGLAQRTKNQNLKHVPCFNIVVLNVWTMISLEAQGQGINACIWILCSGMR